MMTRGRFAALRRSLFWLASANRRPLWLAISLTIVITSVHWFAPRPAVCPPKASLMLLLTAADIVRCNLIEPAHAGVGERVRDAIGGGALGQAAEKLTEAIMNGSLRELARQLGRAYADALRQSVDAVSRGIGLVDAGARGRGGAEQNRGQSGWDGDTRGSGGGSAGGPGLF